VVNHSTSKVSLTFQISAKTRLTKYRQHFDNIHKLYHCNRCGIVFETRKLKDDHERLEPSQMCETIAEERWSITDHAEGISYVMQKRIRWNLSPRGQQALSEETRAALEIWVQTNITEYVGDKRTAQDELELKNWYLIWLALFPGINVPSHPCKLHPRCLCSPSS
jgi:hypothetical protein